MIVREYEEDEIHVHKVPLMLMGGLIAITLALTASVSFGFFERQAIPDLARSEAGTTMTATRSLQFYDEVDGTVRVEDASTGEEIVRYGPGTGGFVRTTMRSFAHQRRIRGIGRETPFELIQWDNGSITLRDPTTGKGAELSAFGPGNHKTFADMLEKEAR